MKETTTLNALVMHRARDLIAARGWPEHTDAELRDPVNRPGWISIYARLNAADLQALIPRLCAGDIPAELQRAMLKITDTEATVILSGNRYADAPELPGDGTQISFPWAGEWLTETEIAAIKNCLSRELDSVCTQVLEDSRRIHAALTTNWETLFCRHTRNFSLIVKEIDLPCWLDEDDESLPFVLDAILNKGARYCAVEVFISCEASEQILASSQKCDVLRIPGEPPHRWMDLNLVHETIEEARNAIRHIRQALVTIRT